MIEEASPPSRTMHQAIVEIVSDSGEGAQKAGQAFGAVSAKMGNGVWTVEIIPAEIKPPARSKAGGSGIRIRLGSEEMTNMGNKADLVIAFNEQVLLGRIEQGAYRAGTHVLLENMWKDDRNEEVREAYAATYKNLIELGYMVHELPMNQACLEFVANPRVGKNMFVLGILTQIFQRDLTIVEAEIRSLFGRKGEEVVSSNLRLLNGGMAFAAKHFPMRINVPLRDKPGRTIVCNGNQAIGMGVMASGMELVSMYPITPATSASHHLAGAFIGTGGVVHQAEDEIAAIGFAIGASYAGKTACTITSGPGLALKTEFVGLAVMAEIPLVIVLVQRGGPSTGLPTKVEQGDLLASLYGATGDAPKIVMAAATIEDCFYMVITARRLAETFRGPVIVLTDANLATGVAPMKRPTPTADWLAAPLDQSDWKEGLEPYAWDKETGLSPRPIPGQKGGMYVLTGLAHTPMSKVAYDPTSNQVGCEMRSKKLASLQSTLRTPEVFGPQSGKLLVVTWGSTLGAAREAIGTLQNEGHSVSSVHLRFLSPLEPGLKQIFDRFDHVMTMELNYADPYPPTPGTSHRTGQLAMILRSETLHDVSTYAVVAGQPFAPQQLHDLLLKRLPLVAPDNLG
jgi:2-oxoglutarate ferredoxin oxidoreductase subunit alpha